MPISGNHKHNSDYYKKQKMMCKNLGIRPPPEKMGIIRKFKYIYRQLTRGDK